MTEFSFVHMADPQFGLFAASSGKTPEEITTFLKRGIKIRPVPKMDGMDPEIELFTTAIEATNDLGARFAVVCGDIVNSPNDEAQLKIAREIADGLDDSISLKWVSGNHEIAPDFRTPSPELLAWYRREFGQDYYSFTEEGVTFLVLNSTVLNSPDTTGDEAKEQLAFIEESLIKARANGTDALAAFSHHPPFLESPDEPDCEWTISRQLRAPLMDLFYKHGVSTVFSGHWHRNNIANSNGLEVVCSGPVGYPLGDDPSGYRVVRYRDGAFEHEYRPLGPAPDNSALESWTDD